MDEQIRKKATEWFVRIQSAQLSSQDESAFFSWLSEKPEHQAAYIQAEEFWGRLSVVEEATASEGASTEPVAPQQIKTDGRRSRWLHIPTWQWGLGGACAAMVLVLVLLVPQSVDSPDVYQTSIGEQRQLALTDGSSVHLNTNSLLQVSRQGASRSVLLDKGEAFFDVASDPQRPFVVRTRVGSVRVLGTKFSVRVKQGDMLVTVVEGEVAVTPVSNDEPATTGRTARLTANQQLAVSAIEEGIKPANVNAAAHTRWREGKLVYNNISFDEMIGDLSRYFEGELKLGDSNLASKKVVAVFDLQDKPHTIAALASAFNLRVVEYPGNQTVLYSNP